MKKLKVYLDNCCFNRPYDDQSNITIKIETEAKLDIQNKIKRGVLDLVWSYILDFENYKNPLIERKIEISKWRALSIDIVVENDKILSKMNEIIKFGIKPLDSLHLSCAIYSKCDYFLTVDRGILNKTKKINEIEILNPIDVLYKLKEL